jgi:hypothetical protein
MVLADQPINLLVDLYIRYILVGFLIIIDQRLTFVDRFNCCKLFWNHCQVKPKGYLDGYLQLVSLMLRIILVAYSHIPNKPS